MSSQDSWRVTSSSDLIDSKVATPSSTRIIVVFGVILIGNPPDLLRVKERPELGDVPAVV